MRFNRCDPAPDGQRDRARRRAPPPRARPNEPRDFMEASDFIAGSDAHRGARPNPLTPRGAGGTAADMRDLEIAIEADDAKHVVLAVAGEIDMATAPKLAQALRMHTECDVTLDLSAVSFLDSSGFAVLVDAYNTLRQTGHALRTTREANNVLTAMRIVGLADIFHGEIPESPSAS
jgi:anti-sigma B factor antagonist